MKQLFSKISKNKFFVSIATLMSGSLIAQAIGVLISPLMTRIYTEEQIGEYTLLLTAVTMFGAVICGRYDMSIVNEEKEDNVFALVKLSFVITFVLSLLVGIGYSVYFHVIESINMSLIPMFLWIFVLLFMAGIGHILLSYNNRNKEYGIMASVHVVREVGKGFSLIGLGLLGFGRIGLLISYFIGSVLGFSKQAEKLKPHIKEIKDVSGSQMISVAKKHIKQPLFSLPASFANSFSYSVINIFINSLFGTVSLAYYSMSYRMLGIPLGLVSTNVSKAYFEKASREYEKTGRFNRTFVQTTLFLLAIAIPMVIILMIFAPWAFELFFGDGWRVSGEYVRYLAPMFGIRLVVSALTPTMIICNKQNIELIIQACFMISSVLVYIIFRNNISIEYFLVAISVLFSIVYIGYYLIMMKLSFKERKIQND